jgi:O-acetyl-ADP-ribose deacetylase (regulator of RNase III)
MLTYVTINLFKSPAQTLVNTINTVGVMGKGIALSFKNLYPTMYQEYRQLCQDGKLDIGKLHIYRTPNKFIVNFPTKKHWRNPSKIEYIEAGLQEFVRIYDRYGISSVSFPQLGCGNGELDWEGQVKPLMEHYLKDLPIPVYIHLYPKSPEFVPERLDADYARQVQLERQIISFDELWNGLQADVANNSTQLSFFSPDTQLAININEEQIIFRLASAAAVTVDRPDLEDLWNILRLRGTISAEDVPQPIQANKATSLIFDFLSHMPYIQPIELQPLKHNTPIAGLQFLPPPHPQPLEEAEIVV